MSSAAKLRYIGRGTAVVASAALVMTSFGPAAFASWDDAPQTPNTVDQLSADGTIGIVDTDRKTAKTQSAPMLEAGKDGQQMADVRLVLPNRFKKGDVVDLRLFDRSATEQTDGNTNAGPSTKLEFSGAPTVKSVTLSNDDTEVAATNPANNDVAPPTGSGAKTNTETGLDNPWKAKNDPAVAGNTEDIKPSNAPAFDMTTYASGTQGYKDVVRLTINNDPSNGDQNAVWVVTLSDLKVNLGDKLTPGELRLVPFAYNTGSKLQPSPWFNGNTEFNDYADNDPSNDVQREIGIYTVPAYVSPVKVTFGERDVVSDGTAQSIGAIELTETQPYAWVDGNLVVKVAGPSAVIASAASNLNVTLNGQKVTLSSGAVNTTAGTITIPMTGLKSDVVDTLKIEGLQVRADKPQTITYSVDPVNSSSIQAWLADGGNSGRFPAANSTSPTVWESAAFCGFEKDTRTVVGAETNRLFRSPQNITGASRTAVTNTVVTVASFTPGAGSDVLPAGVYTATSPTAVSGPDGTTFTYAAATGFLTAAPAIGVTAGADTYTLSGNPALAAGDTFQITTGKGGQYTITAALGADVLDVTPATTDEMLPHGAYTWTDGSAASTIDATGGTVSGPVGTGLTFDITAVNTTANTATLTVTNVTSPSTIDVGDTYTVSTTALAAPTAGPGNTWFTIANPALPSGIFKAGTAAAPNVYVTKLGSADLPAGTWAMSADSNTITGPSTLTRVSGNTYQAAADGSSIAGQRYTIDASPAGSLAGRTFFTNASGQVSAIAGNPVNVTSSRNLPAGTYFVTGTPGNYTIAFDTDGNGVSSGGDTNYFTGVTNGAAVSPAGAGAAAGLTGTYTFNGLQGGAVLSVQAGGDILVDDECVNQDDIVADVTGLGATGLASAGTTAIGGTNRFGTAARIAKEYVEAAGGLGSSDIAIIVNGMQAPDALSSSFLSQREGAPILLTAPGQLPSETVESLRDLGVRKVYIVGGRTAVGSSVFDALKNQDAYMWDAAAKAIKPRGSKLEVVQLGGDNRYQTNWRVNTYAAAQTAGNAPVGKIAVGYGQALKTTAMVARSSTSNDFVDALSASVLSAGRAGGLEVTRKAGDSVSTVSFATPNVGLVNSTDGARFADGTYRVNSTQNAIEIQDGAAWRQVGTLSANVITPTSASDISGLSSIVLSGAPGASSTFTVARTAATGAEYGYDTAVAKTNALPVILTQPTTLVPEAASQMRALHIEHTLLIGSDAALAKKVNDDIAAVGPTSYRIEGKDRWETAANVNRFAMAPEAVTTAGQIPGLGFDGSHVYSDNARTNRVDGEMVAYLANGMKFPDALVAGPWVSRTRNSMVMTLQNDLPEPTAVFINEKAAQLDRAAGLGQGAAVSSGVIVEANKIASTK